MQGIGSFVCWLVVGIYEGCQGASGAASVGIDGWVEHHVENTFVVYSADNGYHLGQHRSFPGKTSNLEEDIK